MTISSTVNRADYVGTGTTGPFAYPFKVFAATDLEVTTRGATTGVETTLSYPTDFTATGVGNAAGGSITLTTALATGDTLTIRRIRPLTQLTSLRNAGTFFPASHEDAFDHFVMIDQQQQDDIDRAMRLPVTVDPATVSLELPVPESGKALMWTTDGSGLENRTVDNAAIALPGNGRTVATASDYLDHNKLFNPLDYGALGDGVRDDSAEVQNAADQALAAGGTLLWPAGKTFNIGTTTISVQCNSRNDGASILYAGTDVAVVVGVAGAVTMWGHFGLPSVVQGLKTDLGWAQAGGADVGVRLLNLDSSRIEIPRIASFAVGLDVRGEGRGCVYNHIVVGQLDNNKVNHKISADATGWSNENNYFGGRFSFNTEEGTNVAGTRHVLVESSTNVANNNRWWGCSLEGDEPEFHVECYGQFNFWNQCRWEAAPPKVQFNGASAIKNKVTDGYNAEGITFTQVNGAAKNVIDSPPKSRRSASVGASGQMVLGSTSSVSDPLYVGVQPGSDALTANPATDYLFAISAATYNGKAATDANPRVQLDHRNGKMLLGNGTAAPTAGWQAYGSTGVIHVGTFLGFYGVNGVTRPAALTQTYSTADRTLSAYTPNVQSTVYTGAADGEAKLADLNALRVAYENLRAFTEDLAKFVNALVDDLQAVGLEQ